MTTNKKLRTGYFEESASESLQEFWNSIRFDRRLLREDIEGSLAHAAMLQACGILSEEEGGQISAGLREVFADLESGKSEFSLSDEDVHMNVERLLLERIGPVAGKLHTARSRNDQVALDMHLFVRKACVETVTLLALLQSAFCDQADENGHVIIPGFTHLQRAQPVLLGHHLLAYCWMLQRDIARAMDCWKRTNVSPLGAGALAGSTFPIDREMTARALGFHSAYPNSMDAVSDRDFVVEMLAVNVLWSSAEFGFITVSGAFSTGSSIMPQKKNADLAELVRGKTGRVYGSLLAMLTTLKGLPLTYNKDFQEDKEGLFDSVDTVQGSLLHVRGMIATLKVNAVKARKAASQGFLNATDLADYLAKKGVPFREAHEIVGRVIAACLPSGKELLDLSLAELHKFSKRFEEDVFSELELEAVVNRRRSLGGTAPEEVDRQIVAMRQHILQSSDWVSTQHRESGGLSP